MKYLTMLAILFFALPCSAGIQSCGTVTINQMLSGPKHGAMIRVSDSNCGYVGWVCLDPEAEFTSAEVSNRTYSLILAFYMANKPIDLDVYDDKFPSACGPYPALYDVRTPAP